MSRYKPIKKVPENNYDAIEITLSEQALKRCGSNVRMRKDIINNTRNVLGDVINRPTLPPYNKLFSVDMIDPHATVKFKIKRKIVQPQSLYHAVLLRGRSASGWFLSKLLPAIEDPNTAYTGTMFSGSGTKGMHPLWMTYQYKRNFVHFDVLFEDERIDVEVTDKLGKKSLLNQCCTDYTNGLDGLVNVLHAKADITQQHITQQHINGVVHQSKRLYKKDINYIKTLLDRGAVLDPHWVNAEYKSKDLFYNSVLEPYIDKWNEEWEIFKHDNTPFEDITQTQFNHFFSLGKIPELFTSKQWSNQGQEMMVGYLQLPAMGAKGLSV